MTSSSNTTHKYDGSLDRSQHWVAVTIIEDDDLMFGGKPLSTWYEEDRRRYSLGDEGAPSPASSSADDDEEQHRGRQRVRQQYQSSPKQKASDISSQAIKKQH